FYELSCAKSVYFILPWTPTILLILTTCPSFDIYGTTSWVKQASPMILTSNTFLKSDLLSCENGLLINAPALLINTSTLFHCSFIKLSRVFKSSSWQRSKSKATTPSRDRKSTRLNSSHVKKSYA